MKYGLFIFLFITQSAFALYGSKVETSHEAFVVSLHIKDARNPKFDFFCIGVLISKTKVLTAGHCIDVMGLEIYDYSHGLIYMPEVVAVKVGGKSIRAKSVTISPMYFEGNGLEAEDLAIIELETPVTNVQPIPFASKAAITKEKHLTLIARGKKTTAYRSTIKGRALIINESAGTCRGDSGGAVVINENGQQRLAGILIYDGADTCERKTGYAYLPKAQF